MAIYTRFGSEVLITGYQDKTADIEINYPEDGSFNYVKIMDLKADNGIQEIEEAINKVK